MGRVSVTKRFSRRDGLKLTVAGLAAGTAAAQAAAKPVADATRGATPGEDPWRQRFDRIWIGGEFWANPMEDWHISDGGTECRTAGSNRSIHSLVHRLADASAPFRMSVRVRNIGKAGKDGGAALRIGIRSDIDEYRSSCFVHQGIDAGLRDGKLMLGQSSASLVRPAAAGQEVELRLEGAPRSPAYALVLSAYDPTNGAELGRVEEMVWPDSILGNVAVVSNFTKGGEGAEAFGSRWRFTDWTIAGDAFSTHEDRRFGPILWAMYTLTDTRGDEGHVLKLSALTGPLGADDSHDVELQAYRDGKWGSLGSARFDTDAWVATFRIPKWDARGDVPYRLVYREKLRGGREKLDQFTGTIRRDPAGRPLRMAALTCQNDYAFPYAPVADNVAALAPDLLLFSGDQLYENHGGFGLIRWPAEAAILNYLRKYYQFGWAFRDAMRHAPTVCLPDDHDVFQGNLWGEAGAPMPPEYVATGRSDGWGGFIEPARMVNTVHRTHVAHLPDPVDPEPVKQGISVYHTEMLYGGVSFAILADRLWKSGPEMVGVDIGDSGLPMPPVAPSKNYDRADLELLGERQEDFLKRWGKDWRGHKLKAVLSQTVFASISTHQPRPDAYLKYDFDSSGFPHTARNRAVRLMRDAKALHICGDTHLGTLSQYGVERQRDANWAFCTPAIAVGWARWWNPDRVGMPVEGRPAHGLPDTGGYHDSFGNPIYVYAVGNPEVGTAPNRYVMAHQKGSGFGTIEFDTERRTYHMNAYRFISNPASKPAEGQFPGWPVTIHQDENTGRNRLK